MRGNTSGPYVDTDVIIRLLTGDDLKKQEAAAQLFEKVSQGKLTLFSPDTVIADSVYVLASSSLYDLPRTTIRDLLAALLNYPYFKVDNKQTVLAALDLYASTNLDFGDAVLAVLTQQSSQKTVYSYDHDFDRLTNITRKEP